MVEAVRQWLLGSGQRAGNWRPVAAWAVCVVVTASLLTGAAAAGTEIEQARLLSDWAVQPGLSLSVASEGYSLPTAIAVVPEPGPEPDDPLYYVTEIRGAVKVVTRDGTVETFAEVPTITPEEELPETGAAQSGLAGICLDPPTGSVIITYTYPDEGGILRNNIVRYSTTPETFGVEPQESMDFTEIFAPYQSAAAHQIGQCQVDDGRIFVGVGDGGNPSAASDLNVLLGKIVCLTLDGESCPGHPFEPEGEGNAAAYVWAYGFRNPFGVSVDDGQVYVAGNGVAIDRFLTVEKGQDHHWDGSDDSIATGADVVFDPTVSPVQTDFIPVGAPGVPEEYTGRFVFATFIGTAGVLSVPWDAERGEPSAVPEYLLEYRGRGGGRGGEDDTEDSDGQEGGGGAGGTQQVTGVALGPDGLYVVPLLPDSEGNSVILKLSAAEGEQEQHPQLIGEVVGGDPALALMSEKGCFSCHSLDGQGGGIGPSLDSYGINFRITARLNSPAYAEQVAMVNQLDSEPFVSWREEREEVLSVQGRARTRLWIKYRLLEPRFDDPDAQMPDLPMTEQEAATISAYLVGSTRQPGLLGTLYRGIAVNRLPVAFGLAAGVVLTVLFFGAIWIGRRIWRRVRRPSPG